MAIIREGHLRCPGCREYVIEADPEQYPDGVDYETPDADESKVPCGECAPRYQNIERLREPTDIRRIPSNSVRHLQKPRWAAYYESEINSPPADRPPGPRGDSRAGTAS
ncbi:hypothetical protein [Streptomyces sp. NPDC003032]